MTTWKDAVRVATTGSNITLSGLQTIDGVAVAANDRVLVKDQTTTSANGIYSAASGAWARTSDANTAALLPFASVIPVSAGTINAQTQWILSTPGTITLGTTALTFTVEAPRFNASVRAATTGNNLTLSGTQTVDGVSLSAGDPILVKDQSSAPTNGIYAVSTGSWSRVIDPNIGSLATPESVVRVSEGIVNAHTRWNLMTTAPITLGTTSLKYAKLETYVDLVRIATTGTNITLSGLSALDGVTPIDGDRILVKDQTTASANGVYAAHTGAWTRATDTASVVRVSSGALNAGTQWGLATPLPITIGTTGLAYFRSQSVSAASSIKSLQSLAGPFNSGDTTQIAGYYAPNDGGGGDFYFEGVLPSSATVIGATSSTATITGAANATPIKITSTAHGFVNGQSIVVSGVGGLVEANGSWLISNVTANTFDLVNSAKGASSYTSGGTASSVVVTTSAAHGLSSGTIASIGNVVGVTGFAINGRWSPIGRATSSSTFSIPCSTTGSYASGGAVGDAGMSIPSNFLQARWLRNAPVGLFDVKWFGAVGDCANDTFVNGVTHDDLPAFKATLAAMSPVVLAAQGRGAVLHIPALAHPNSYWLNGDLPIEVPCLVEGDASSGYYSESGTYLSFAGGYGIKLHGAHNSPHNGDASGSRVSRLHIKGRDVPGCTLWTANTNYAIGDRVRFKYNQCFYAVCLKAGLSSNTAPTGELAIHAEPNTYDDPISMGVATYHGEFPWSAGLTVYEGYWVTDPAFPAHMFYVTTGYGTPTRTSSVRPTWNTAVGGLTNEMGPDGTISYTTYAFVSFGAGCTDGTLTINADGTTTGAGVLWGYQLATGVQLMSASQVVEHVSVENFPNAAFTMLGHAIEPTETLCDTWKIATATCVANGLGCWVSGGDSNAGKAIDVNVYGRGIALEEAYQRNGHCFLDASYLGCSWIACEAQSDRLIGTSAIKNLVATSTSAQVYTTFDGSLGGGPYPGPTPVIVSTYPTGNAFVKGSTVTITGTDLTGTTQTEVFTLTLVGGGETIRGTKNFRTVTQINTDAQANASSYFFFGVFRTDTRAQTYDYWGASATSHSVFVGCYSETGLNRMDGQAAVLGGSISVQEFHASAMSLTPAGVRGFAANANDARYLYPTKNISHVTVAADPNIVFNWATDDNLGGGDTLGYSLTVDGGAPGWYGMLYQNSRLVYALSSNQIVGERGGIFWLPEGFGRGNTSGPAQYEFPSQGTYDSSSVRNHQRKVGDMIWRESSTSVGGKLCDVVTADGYAGETWVASHAYYTKQINPPVGNAQPADVVKPSDVTNVNRFRVSAISGGNGLSVRSGPTEPTWTSAPSLGNTVTDTNVTDGTTITWINIGVAAMMGSVDVSTDLVNYTRQPTQYFTGNSKITPKHYQRNIQTTTNTPATFTFGLTDSAVTRFDAKIAAYEETGTGARDGASFVVAGCWLRNSSVVTTIKAGTTTETNTNASGLAWTCVVSISTTNIVVTVTGDAGKTIQWTIDSIALETIA